MPGWSQSWMRWRARRGSPSVSTADNSHQESALRWWIGYVLAAVFTAVAAFWRWALPGVLAGTPYLAFYPAVVASAGLFGRGPGLLATVLCLLCVDVLFDTTSSPIAFADPVFVTRQVIFLAGGVGISMVAGRQKAARARQQKQAVELAQVVQLLDLANVVVRDLDDRITRWNKGSVRLYGFSVEQAVGQISHELLRTRFPEPLETIRATLMETDRWQGELTHTTADGRDLVVASEWVLQRGGPGQPSVILEVNTDVTERKRAEAAQAQLAAIVESSTNAIFTESVEGLLQTWNGSAERLFGYRADEVIGHPATLLMPSDQHKEGMNTLRRLCAGERIQHFESVRVGKDGRQLDVSVSVSPIKDREGRVVGASTILRDIRERKAQEAALRESERRLALAVGATGIGMFEWHLASGNVLCSDQLVRLLGITTNATTSTTTLSQSYRYSDWSQRVHPEDLPRVESELQRCLGANAPFEAEYRLVWSDGSVRWLVTRGVFLQGREEQPEQMLGIVMDITQRKEAEAALQESEMFYRQTLESIPGMVFTTRSDGYCDYQSQQWAEYTGVPMSEHIGDGWNKLLHPDDQPRALAAWRAAVEERAS